MASEAIFEAQALSKEYVRGATAVPDRAARVFVAVDSVTLEIHRGENAGRRWKEAVSAF